MKTTDVIISKTSGDVIVFICEKHRYFFTCEISLYFHFGYTFSLLAII